MARESQFEKDFCKRLKNLYPGSIIIKGNSAMRQGIPDRLFLWGPHWAFLEFKRDGKAPPEVNQTYYVQKLREMSYAAFVNPSNAEEVIREIHAAFGR